MTESLVWTGLFFFDSLQKPNFSAIDGSLRLFKLYFFSLWCSSVTSAPSGGRVKHECIFETVRWVSGVVFYCGITLLLFTTDQENTVYRGYIDIWKVLMFIQSFLYSLFSYMYISCVFWSGLHEYKQYITHVLPNCEPGGAGDAWALRTSSRVCFLSDRFLPA